MESSPGLAWAAVLHPDGKYRFHSDLARGDASLIGKIADAAWAGYAVRASSISSRDIEAGERDLRTAAVPVVLIGTASGRAEMLAGFEAGASEFLMRPLDPHLFAARVEALLRHLWESVPGLRLAAGAVTMDTADHTVEIKGSRVLLTGKEFALLELFLRRPGKLLSGDFIKGMVWGAERPSGSHTLTVHIQRLRGKLGPAAGRLIETVHGLGYRLNTK